MAACWCDELLLSWRNAPVSTVLTAPEVTKAALEAGTTIEVVLPESILDNPVLWHLG